MKFHHKVLIFLACLVTFLFLEGVYLSVTDGDRIAPEYTEPQ